MASKARQFREHWADELDGAAMYRALAERSDGEQREIFLELSRAEERHAAHWAAKLVELGEPEPRPEQPRQTEPTIGSIAASERWIVWQQSSSAAWS